MTYYPGGKKKIGEDIADQIADYIHDRDLVVKGYCEPFCGMLGVYQHMIGELNTIDYIKKNKDMKYLAGDRNPYLIKLWKGLQKGWRPPTKCSEKEYYKYKKENNKSLKSIFVGFACAYRGDFRSSFSKERNISLQAEHSVEIGKIVKNVKFKAGNYDMFSHLKDYLIYCDPPYKNTQNPYLINESKNNSFDYSEFIKWCKKIAKNNVVFISEYTKPCKESKLLWKKGKERLYVITI